jgi:predicted Fe-Mo cluster-binding NifX family protein
MLIWIPVEDEKGIDSKIVSQTEAKKWALIDFDAGEIRSIRFYDNREESEEAWVDFVILVNKYENYLDFMNEGMMVLVIREEETIEEIMNAFKFKELDEIGL